MFCGNREEDESKKKKFVKKLKKVLTNHSPRISTSVFRDGFDKWTLSVVGRIELVRVAEQVDFQDVFFFIFCMGKRKPKKDSPLRRNNRKQEDQEIK